MHGISHEQLDDYTVARSKLLNFCKLQGIVDLRLIPVTSPDDESRTVIQGRVLLEQDGYSVDFESLTALICQAASWYGTTERC